MIIHFFRVQRGYGEFDYTRDHNQADSLTRNIEPEVSLFLFIYWEPQFTPSGPIGVVCLNSMKMAEHVKMKTMVNDGQKKLIFYAFFLLLFMLHSDFAYFQTSKLVLFK